jgi:hypothetical protein
VPLGKRRPSPLASLPSAIPALYRHSTLIAPPAICRPSALTQLLSVLVQTNGQVTAASVVSAIALPLDIDVPGNVCVVGAVNSFGDVEALALGSGESNAILEALTAEDGRPQEPVRLLVPHPLVQELTRMRDANLSKYGHMTIIGYASIVELLRLSGRTTSRTC